MNTLWIVAQTKPMQEKKAYYNLTNQGYEPFLPMTTLSRHVKGKWIDRQEVLFPAYIFIKYKKTSVIGPINNTIGIRNLLVNKTDLSPHTIDDSTISLLTAKSLKVNSFNIYKLTKVDKILVSNIGNDFIDAVFLESNGASRAKVLINFLNHSCKTTVDINKLYIHSPL